MATIRRWALVAPALFALAIGLVACGGGDDDDDDGGSDSGGSTSAGTGSDEEYVSAVCGASAKFAKSLESLMPKLVSASSESDAKKLARELVKPIDEFAAAMSKAKPPADVKEYHNKMVKALRDMSAAVKKGDERALAAFDDSDLPEPPAKVQERLQKIAEKNKDCKESGFLQ